MRWKLCGLVLLVWAGSAEAGPDDLPREVLLLAHFKQQMRQVLSQVPNYTCLETIQRSARGAHASAFTSLDTVLLEISNLENKELLAWPGAHRFEDGDLTSFASGGLMGSGVFASFAQDVFLGATTTIRYYGGEEIAGRALTRFDFRIPEVWSGFRLKANGASAKVGTMGSFWMDPDSMELVRLSIRADDIPPAVGIERTATVIDYARMRIGETDVLLPQDAKMLLMLISGEIRQNDIAFSHCHEYRTESSIRFDMPDTSEPVSAPPVRLVDLPAGLLVSVELETAIDSGTAHVGDLLRGHVINDVGLKGKAIIVPKGALVTGRIRGLERLRSPEPAFEVTIELAELEWENARSEFYGELLRNPMVAGAPRTPGTGVFHMKGTQFHIAAGFQMNWRTLEPNQRLRKSK
jgi:hypothetical protein